MMVSLYLKNPVAPLHSNPMEQWEDMKIVFPLPYKQARQYLHTSAISVPSELFSKAGATISKARNRLNRKRVISFYFWVNFY